MTIRHAGNNLILPINFMNQNSRPIKGREAYPAVPPLLVALQRPTSSDGCMAIGSPVNAGVAFLATNVPCIHPDSSGGNFAGSLPGGVSVCAHRLPVGFRPATFLFHSFCILLPLLSANVIFCQAFPDQVLVLSQETLGNGARRCLGMSC